MERKQIIKKSQGQDCDIIFRERAGTKTMRTTYIPGYSAPVIELDRLKVLCKLLEDF